jgi:hypothetical protein
LLRGPHAVTVCFFVGPAPLLIVVNIILPTLFFSMHSP